MATYTSMKVRDSSRASPVYGGMNYRMRQILADEQVDTRQCPDLAMFDLSQTMNRTPRSGMHASFPGVLCSPTLLPGTQLWLSLPDPMAGCDSPCSTHPRVQVERWIHPDEMLQWQGWPLASSPVDLAKIPPATKASFAGNMFSSSVIMSVFMALMCAIEWSDGELEDESEDDIDDMLNAVSCTRAL